MSEQPAAQLPWIQAQKLLHPLECFKIDSGFLIAPKNIRTLIALLHVIDELKISFTFSPLSNDKVSSTLSITNRALKKIHYLEDDRVSVEAGCEWLQLKQTLYEEGWEVCGFIENILPVKSSVATLVTQGFLKYYGAEFVTVKGEQILSGSPFATQLPGFKICPLDDYLKKTKGILTTVILKIKPIVYRSIEKLWGFKFKNEAVACFETLKKLSQKWDQLIYIESFSDQEKQMIFAKFNGSANEVKALETYLKPFLNNCLSFSFQSIQTYLQKQQMRMQLDNLNIGTSKSSYVWHTLWHSWRLSLC